MMHLSALIYLALSVFAAPSPHYSCRAAKMDQPALAVQFNKGDLDGKMSVDDLSGFPPLNLLYTEFSSKVEDEQIHFVSEFDKRFGGQAAFVFPKNFASLKSFETHLILNGKGGPKIIDMECKFKN